jgi:succinate dehydrogenase/fumarate reductase flavoprotein subunit
VFGAARLGGAALAEAIVFGAVAGENAAELARIRRAPSAPDTGALMNDTQACLGRGPVRVAETRERLGRILWECAGPVKTEASLMEAEERLGELSARTRTADAADGTGAALHEQVELEAMLTLAPLLCRASRMRRETRGCFWRADHPQPDHDGWLRNIVVRRGADGPEWEVRPVTVTRSMPPSEPPIGAGCFGYLPNL